MYSVCLHSQYTGNAGGFNLNVAAFFMHLAVFDVFATKERKRDGIVVRYSLFPGCGASKLDNIHL